MCAHLRSTVSHVPRPVPRLGIDENAKITAAQSDDRQPDRERAAIAATAPMLVSRHKPASGKGIRCKSGTVPPL